MQLGQSIFTPLQPNDGGYVGADTAGYQIMLNYRGDQRAVTWVPLEDVLNGRVAPALIRDRVVLIGNIAESGKDFFYTPFSSGLRDNQRMAGVFIHAQMVGQFIDAGLGDRAVIWFYQQCRERLDCSLGIDWCHPCLARAPSLGSSNGSGHGSPHPTAGLLWVVFEIGLGAPCTASIDPPPWQWRSRHLHCTTSPTATANGDAPPWPKYLTGNCRCHVGTAG